MNFLAFQMAFSYLKILGDFVNNPDSFANPDIIKYLEKESHDNPIKDQGFLSQILKMEKVKADEIDFQFQKILKQQAFQKNSKNNQRLLRNQVIHFNESKVVVDQNQPDQSVSSSDQQNNKMKTNKQKQELINSVKEKAKNTFKAILLLIQIFIVGFYFISLVQFNHLLEIYEEVSDGVANGYTEFIEKQQIVTELDDDLKGLLKKLEWYQVNCEGRNSLSKGDGILKSEDYQGERYFFDLHLIDAMNFVLHKQSKIRDIKDNLKGKIVMQQGDESTLDIKQSFYAIKDKIQYLYYEVEVSYLHDMTKLIIGYIDQNQLAEIKGTDFPGKVNLSVGFNVKTGEVYIDENLVYTFNFMDAILEVYNVDDSKNFDFNGCFFGVGISMNTNEFFFTFNGRILNSLSYQAIGEMRFQVYNKIRKDELEQDEKVHKVNKIQSLANKIGLQKSYKEELKKQIQFKSKIKKVVPIIYINGVGKFYINIGGSPFIVRERHVRTGLLKKSLC